MTGLALALAAGYGAFLLYTAVALGWRGIGVGPARTAAARPRQGAVDRIRQSLPPDVRVGEYTAVMLVLFGAGVVATFTIFGGIVPAVLGGLAAATAPVVAQQRRVERRRAQAAES